MLLSLPNNDQCLSCLWVMIMSLLPYGNSDKVITYLRVKQGSLRVCDYNRVH